MKANDGSRVPLNEEEFLERLQDPEATVWGSELREFLKYERPYTLKQHLIKAGLINERRTMHRWKTTVAKLLEHFVPYVQKLRPLPWQLDEFLEQLEDRELIPRTEILTNRDNADNGANDDSAGRVNNTAR